MFISVIGCIASVIGALLAFFTYRKTVQDRVILAHDYLKILNDDMKGLVEFICNSITICTTRIGKYDYQRFMLETRLLDSYLSYFIYEKEHSILNALELSSEHKELIKKKQVIVQKIRDKIFVSRNKYRNNSGNMININDVKHFRTVYDEITGMINNYQEEMEALAKKRGNPEELGFKLNKKEWWSFGKINRRRN